MRRVAWTQLQEVEMHPFIPVFLPRKEQLVGSNEAQRHFCISLWSESPFLWIFCCSFQRSGFCQEKRSTRKRGNPPCVAKMIQSLFGILFWEGPWEEFLEQTHWYSLHQSGIILLGVGVPIPVSPWLDFQYGEWLKEYFWRPTAVLLLQVLFLALSGLAELITECNWAIWENAANPRRSRKSSKFTFNFTRFLMYPALFCSTSPLLNGRIKLFIPTS